MIQVAVLTPVPAMRAGLRALIAADEEFVVGEAVEPAGLRVAIMTEDMLEASEMVPPDVPVLLVLDANSALFSTGVSKTPLPAALTGRPAWGVISSEATGEALRAAARALVQGLVVLPPEQAQGLLEQQWHGQTPDLGPDSEPLEPLTAREGDVLRLLALGKTNRQIAAALGISEHTVKFHVSAIYAKLRVSNRAEAVRTGARWGLVAL